MKKKSQGLPINVIILLGLGLAVFIVLIILFTSEAGDFSKGILSCEGKGGKCVEKGKCEYEKTSWSCPRKEEPECCYNPLSR